MAQHYIFDLYGTLLDIRTDEDADTTWNAFAAWMTAHGMPCRGSWLRRVYRERCRALTRAAGGTQCPEIELTPVFASICRQLDRRASDALIHASGEAFRRCSTRLLTPYPNTLRVLEGLRAAGKNVWLLTNAQRLYTWQELEATGLLPYFDDVLISSDEGCKKPDPAFFRRLLDRHGLDARDCLMVGNDSTADIAGAAAVGMDALYVRTAISPANDPTPACRYVFEDGDIGHVLETL